MTTYVHSYTYTTPHVYSALTTDDKLIIIIMKWPITLKPSNFNQ